MLLRCPRPLDSARAAALFLVWGAAGALGDQVRGNGSHHDDDHHHHHHHDGGSSGWLWLLVPLLVLFAVGIIAILAFISIRLARMEVIVTRTVSRFAKRAYGKAMGREDDDGWLERWKKHDGDDEYTESEPDVEYGEAAIYAPDAVDPHTGGTFTLASTANGDGEAPPKDKHLLYNHKRTIAAAGPAISAEDKRRFAAAQAFKKFRRQQYEDRIKAAQKSVKDASWLPERTTKSRAPPAPAHVVDASKEPAVRKRGRLNEHPPPPATSAPQ